MNTTPDTPSEIPNEIPGEGTPDAAAPTSAPGALTPSEVTVLAGRVVDAVETAVVGKREALELILAGILAGGHVLLEDFPGLGKTLAARSFARALGLEFTRAQFTPDLLPSDLTGSYLYNQRTSEFEFRRGPLFTGLLLADEINRTPPKTQAALLEAMQERQITVEGTTFPLPTPFHVLATANPVEHEGTYPLPEAQVDRFLLRVGFGYPTAAEEVDVVTRRLQRRREDVTVEQVLQPGGLLAAQQAVEQVEVDPSIVEYCVRLTAATRDHSAVQVGASPRGSLALVTVARAHAVVRGRDYVTPEDVKRVAPSALAHRLVIRPELWMSDVHGEAVVAQILESVATPAATEQP